MKYYQHNAFFLDLPDFREHLGHGIRQEKCHAEE